jgi:lysophospholipase L1-like esterase
MRSRRLPPMMRFRHAAANISPDMRLLAIEFVLLVLILGLPLFGQDPRSEQHWVGTWFTASTARVDLPPGQLQNTSPLHFSDQTLRQIAHISVGGSRFRVVFSNALGTAPLAIGAAQVGLRDKDAAIVPQSNRVLTFRGAARTTVPAGAIVTSDPVDLVAADFADLAIDLYLPDDTAAMKSPLTMHPASWQTNYVSPPGNHAGVVTMPVHATTAYRRGDGLVGASSFFLTRIEVLAPRQTGAIATIGDSITDGTASTIDTNNRWPDHLARRVASAGMRMGLLNAGIGGNRVLHEGNGPSALARFDRDVIAQPGVTHVIVLEGINDIGQARESASPSAADLIAAYKQMIARAHARGITAFGATITPFEGANYWTAEGEGKRKAVNDWIRTSKAYDAVFDFDVAVRDPNHPTRLRAEYDPGDHLHLNAAGYQAVANAINLSSFRSR